jgi:hypothetical protein
VSLPDDDWIRAHLPEHLQVPAIAEKVIAHLRQSSSPLRAMFEAGAAWALEAQLIGADLDELEPAHDTEPSPAPEAP